MTTYSAFEEAQRLHYLAMWAKSSAAKPSELRVEPLTAGSLD